MGALWQFRQWTKTDRWRGKLMSNQTINSGEKQKQRDPDLAAAEIAMKRAAQRARERARQVDSGVVILKDGQIVEEQRKI